MDLEQASHLKSYEWQRERNNCAVELDTCRAAALRHEHHDQLLASSDVLRRWNKHIWQGLNTSLLAQCKLCNSKQQFELFQLVMITSFM
jgi:hypothetical protein